MDEAAILREHLRACIAQLRAAYSAFQVLTEDPSLREAVENAFSAVDWAVAGVQNQHDEP